MAHDVFISYSHKNYAIADAVCHYFEEAGLRCWYAPRDIEPGKEWAAAIIEALEQSKIMILIFTDDSNVSVQVRREVDTAVSAGVTIIPFKCTKTKPTGSMKYYLSSLHWMDAVKGPMEKSIEKLLRLTKALLEPKPGKKKKLPWFIGGGAVALALAVLFILSPWKGKDEPAPPEESGTMSVADKETGKAEAATEKGGTAETPASEAVSTEPHETEISDGGANGDSHVDKGETFVFDEDNDSPGAEDYLYSQYTTSDYYPDAIRLDKFFGTPTKKMVIPEFIDGLPVTGIYEKCFIDLEEIEEVVLPERMESIRYEAFYGCRNLKTINFPSRLSCLESWAFAHSGLEEVILPENCDWIGEYCFNDCRELKHVELPEGVEEIRLGTFKSCSSMESIVIPASCEKIDVGAFEGTKQAVIIGEAGSYAEKFAKAMGMTFKEKED